MPDIMHLIKIRATQDKVYSSLATAEGVRGWWTRDTALDPKIGGAGEFGFYAHRMVVKVAVAELTPRRPVGWNPVSSTGGGFDGTNVSFDISAEEGITTVLFAHRGFATSSNNITSATTRW